MVWTDSIATGTVCTGKVVVDGFLRASSVRSSNAVIIGFVKPRAVKQRPVKWNVSKDRS